MDPNQEEQDIIDYEEMCIELFGEVLYVPVVLGTPDTGASNVGN